MSRLIAKGIRDDHDNTPVGIGVQQRLHFAPVKVTLVDVIWDLPSCQQIGFNLTGPNIAQLCEIPVTVDILDMATKILQDVPILGLSDVRSFTEKPVKLVKAIERAGVEFPRLCG